MQPIKRYHGVARRLLRFTSGGINLKAKTIKLDMVLEVRVSFNITEIEFSCQPILSNKHELAIYLFYFR